MRELTCEQVSRASRPWTPAPRRNPSHGAVDRNGLAGLHTREVAGSSPAVPVKKAPLRWRRAGRTLNKELSEWLEVRGYATAADWVYGHAIKPGELSDETPVSLTELRHAHELAMTPVWDVAPPPQATEREGRAHSARVTSNRSQGDDSTALDRSDGTREQLDQRRRDTDRRR